MNNLILPDGHVLTFTAAADHAAGAPHVVGQVPGVVAGDVANGATGELCVHGLVSLSVKGVDGGGNSAVAIGDKLYFTGGDSPKINKKTSGVFFGYAWGAIGSGDTATIHVKLPL